MPALKNDLSKIRRSLREADSATQGGGCAVGVGWDERPRVWRLAEIEGGAQGALSGASKGQCFVHWMEIVGLRRLTIGRHEWIPFHGVPPGVQEPDACSSVRSWGNGALVKLVERGLPSGKDRE
jgi:hypothetical protein